MNYLKELLTETRGERFGFWMFAFLILSIFLLCPLAPAVLANEENSQNSVLVDPITLNMTYDLFRLRMVLYQNTITVTRSGNNNGTVYSYNETELSLPYPLAFGLGNGLCIDMNSNIYLDVKKLLKVDESKNYTIRAELGGQLDDFTLTKTGSEYQCKSKSWVEYKNQITFDQNKAIHQTNGAVDTVYFIENGLEYKSNIPGWIISLSGGANINLNGTLKKEGDSLVFKGGTAKSPKSFLATLSNNGVSISDLYNIGQFENKYIIIKKFGDLKQSRIEYGDNLIRYFEGDKCQKEVVLENNKVTLRTLPQKKEYKVELVYNN